MYPLGFGQLMGSLDELINGPDQEINDQLISVVSLFENSALHLTCKLFCLIKKQLLYSLPSPKYPHFS